MLCFFPIIWHAFAFPPDLFGLAWYNNGLITQLALAYAEGTTFGNSLRTMNLHLSWFFHHVK